ncbi:MAG: glycosyltransferase family 2 protein [Flavobacterium sp.]|nr:glycosyltransferase family 2 protein [Flavobacterium sp.]
MKKNKTIAVLLTCHNRKDKTLTCLQALYECVVPENYSFEVFLVDDGSTDGTGERVKSDFPDVTIILGDGNLYWNRGMYKAWETASNTKGYDFYVWLNDDTMLYTNAYELVLRSSEQFNHQAIICGATCEKQSGKVSYSGWWKSEKTPILPNGEIQQCEIVNGNFLLIPKTVFNKIGNLDWKFRHAIGDFDYGLRAQKAGFKCYITPSFVGSCESNPTLPKWCLISTPIVQRFKLLYSPLGYAEPIPFFIYENRHFGLFTALKHFITINLRAFIPQLWKK